MAIDITTKYKMQMLQVTGDNTSVQYLPETTASQVLFDDKGGLFNDATTVEEALEQAMEVAQTGGVTGVKGEAETEFRKGDVSISKADIGLGSVDDTPDSEKNVKHSDAAGKVDNSLTLTVYDGVNSKESVVFDGSAPRAVEFNVDDFKETAIENGLKISLIDKGYAYKTYVDSQDDKKFDKTGGTVNGNVTITGDLAIKGTTTTVDTQNLEVKDNLITVAKDNEVPLTSPAGIRVPKYDGTNDVALVVDNDGMAKVGKVVLDESGNVNTSESELQTIATRTGLTDGNLVKYDAANNTLVPDTVVESTANSALEKANSNESEINKIKDGTTTVPKAKDAQNVTDTIDGHKISDIFTSDGITAKQAANASNVTTNINGNPITSIFETDGTTVKKATLAETANKTAKALTVSGQTSSGAEAVTTFDGSEAREIAFDENDFDTTVSQNAYSVALADVPLDETHTIEGTYTVVAVNSKGIVQMGGRSMAFIGKDDPIPSDVMINGLIFRAVE